MPGGKKPTPIEQRFFQKFEFGAQHECWLWTGKLHNLGYGKIYSYKTAFFAHRIAYEIFVGPIPSDLCVCHRCDMRNCVNPTHLFLGTHADNMRDKAKKLRGPHKLNKKDILAIRKHLADGQSCRSIGKIFGVDHVTIMCIAHGKTWSHV